MADVRSELLLALRRKQWRSYRQLCRAVADCDASLEVRHHLQVLMGEGLVDYLDNSLRRFKLTVAGMNAAKRAADAKRRRAAA